MRACHKSPAGDRIDLDSQDKIRTAMVASLLFCFFSLAREEEKRVEVIKGEERERGRKN